MNRNDLFSAMEYLDEKTIENSEVRKMKKYPIKFTKRTVLLVAALCLLIAFTTVALAANLFGLRDMLVPSHDPEIKNEMVLSGFIHSKEYMAAAEWKAFVDSYDPDGLLLAQVDPEGPEDIGLDEKYDHYNVYTQEMADKLDQIAAKYGLTLYGKFVPGIASPLAEKLIVNNHIEFSDNAYNTMADGYMFDNGTFNFDGIFHASVGRLSVNYQFRCSVKGVFDPVFLNIGDIESYHEQALVTHSGIPLVAALSKEQAILIAEFNTCFVSINVMGGTDIGITFDDLKDLANTFDFSVIESGMITSLLNVGKTASALAEQEYIEVGLEGVLKQIPVKTVLLADSISTIAADPANFTHTVRENIDIFSYNAWKGEREVYYSLSHIAESNPNQICENLIACHGSNYANHHVFAVKVGNYNATAVQFEEETACPSYQRHFFILPGYNNCIVIETQFAFEMYEGLYQTMLALFNTLRIG